jgi:hypothetical protein
MYAVLGFAVVMVAASSALAGEPADLQKQIDELKAKIDKLETKKDSSAPSGEKKDSWTDKVTLFGDLRYRHEDIEEPHREVDKPDRNRDRIRVRLGLKAAINDEVDATFRLATGDASDPVSTNQTLGSNFAKKTILLDMAYFDYHPQALKDMDMPLSVLGGKMPVPFYTPGGSDLIWDPDLTPEGGAIKLAPKLGDMVELTAALGGFWIQERQASGDPPDNGEDAALFGAQAALKLNFEEKGKIYTQAGVGYFNYTNTRGKASFGGAFGNNLNSDSTYHSGFSEVEGFFEVGFPVLDVPVVLYLDYVTNTGAEKNAEGEKEGTGYMVGFNVGRLKKQWDWSVGYNYREIEKDAVVGAFTDSDSGGGGTNIKGSKFTAQVMVLKNVTVGASFFLDKVNISDTTTVDKDADYRRLQLDIGFKF